MESVIDTIENLVEKGEYAGFRRISLSGWLTLSQTTNLRLFQIERVCRGQF